MPNKLFSLTDDEAKARDRAIDFYRFTGKVDSEANRLAWIDVQMAFPRLQEYDSPPKNS